MNRVGLALVLIVAAVSFLSCGYSKSSYYKPPSGSTTRVFASQSVLGPAALPGLFIINGANDTTARASEISAGNSPGLMALSPDRTTLLVYDAVSNNINVINARTETSSGSVPMPGPTTSMVALATGFGYVAVPSATLIGSPPGAVEVINLSFGLAATIGVPNAQTLVASPDGTHLLVFNDSDEITIMSPLLVNTGNPVTVTVPGCAGCRPVYGVFSSDGSTAYILNSGTERGGTQPASVQTLDLATSILGPPLTVDGATIGLLNGSTLYVAGNSATNGSCSGSTQAKTCGRLDIIDLGSMTVTASAEITDGYHHRIDLSGNGQLFIGSHTCTNIGNVNNPNGEVRGCLSIFNTNTAEVVIPPDNGDVTALQSFTTRSVEYVAEGGKLRVYDTTKDVLLVNSFVGGTIIITGQVIDLKAVDFF